MLLGMDEINKHVARAAVAEGSRFREAQGLSTVPGPSDLAERVEMLDARNGRRPELGEEVSQAEVTYADLTGRDPGTMPEILREQILVAGALDCLEREIRQLEERLAHVLVPDYPRALVATEQDIPSVETIPGRRVRESYLLVQGLEDRVTNLRSRLAV